MSGMLTANIAGHPGAVGRTALLRRVLEPVV